MAATDNPVQVGDLVTVAGREPDVWQVLEARHGAARLRGRSTQVAGTLRWVQLGELQTYATPDDDL